MTTKQVKSFSRYAGLVSVVILLALCFVLLGAAAASEETLLRSPSEADRSVPDSAQRLRPPNPGLEGTGDQDIQTAPASRAAADRRLVLEKNPDYYDAGSVAIT